MPNKPVRNVSRAFMIVAVSWLAGCGAGSSDGVPVGDGVKYTVGGVVSGLSGTVVLQDNGSNDLVISANGSFVFAATSTTGGRYSITVLTQPAGQLCAVVSGAGSFAAANVTGVAVACTAAAAVSHIALFAGSMDVIGSADALGDANLDTIRAITPAGVVTTFAGAPGLQGSTDATGADAHFALPGGVATDGAGNVYVADTGNHTIRKITQAGVVTTLAGAAGLIGSTDGAGGAARFNSPRGVAVDGAGQVFVADSDNMLVRKITPAGVVTTLAGTAFAVGSTDATGAAARFGNPIGIAADSTGNVYVVDTSSRVLPTNTHTIRKITSAGTVTAVVGTAGQQGFAPGLLPGLLSNPRGVVVSGTSLYITLNNGLALVTDRP